MRRSTTRWLIIGATVWATAVAATGQVLESDPPSVVELQAGDGSASASQVSDDAAVYPAPGRPPIDIPQIYEQPEKVVAALSNDAVSITARFDGSDIIIYGAVKRETPVPAGPPLQVIVTIEGPAESLTIRQLARRLGVWVNTEAVHIGAAPGFYAVTTSGPLEQILDPEWDTRYRISIPLAMRSFAGPVSVENAVPYTEALVRLRKENGLYQLDEHGVQVIDQTLFQANVRLPANLVEGDYKTRIFLLREGRVIDVHRAPIEVRKVGIERWLYRLAYDQPFLYGLMSLLVAIAAGWGASTLFRVLRRN